MSRRREDQREALAGVLDQLTGLVLPSAGSESPSALDHSAPKRSAKPAPKRADSANIAELTAPPAQADSETKPTEAPPQEAAPPKDAAARIRKQGRAAGMVERPETGYARMRIAAYLTPETGKRLKIWCARSGVEMSAAIEDALISYLDENEP